MDMYGQWNQQYPPMDPAAAAQAQMYWQQYYGGYGPPQPFYGYGVPPAGMPPMIPPATGGVGGPIPPIEPPKEEQPPLPVEPPPEEEKKASFKQDDNKLSALQIQAAQWQQQKQWEEYQKNLVEYQQQLQQWNSQQAALLDQVTKEEVEFESQYSDWVKQYNDWKEQNKNHPNKEQYQQYEQQWKQYEEQMSQKREYIQQRKRTLLQNQQPSHLTAPTVPADYVPPSPAVAPAAPPSAVHSAVTTAPVSYGYGSNAASTASHSLYDYSGQASSYPSVPPPVASTTVSSAIPGYPPGFAPPPFSAQYPPPPVTGFGAGYGFPGMMMPPPDQTYASTANPSVSAWNASSASSVAASTAYGQHAQQSSNAQGGVPTTVSWSTSQPPVSMQNTQTSVSSSNKVPSLLNSQFQDYSSAEFSGPRPRFPGGAPRGFGNQGDQRWPTPRQGQPGGFGQQNFEPRMGSVRQPGPGFDQGVESFEDPSNQNEEEDWTQSGFEPSASMGFGSGIRPGIPGGFGPRNQGPRSDVPGMRPMMRGPRPNMNAGMGLRPGMVRGPRPLANQQFSGWQEDTTGFEESNVEDPESVNESYGEEMEQPGNIGMMGFGQQGQMFGQMEFQPRGVRPGMASGVRPGMNESGGGPLGRGMTPGVRPGLNESAGGPMGRSMMPSGVRPGLHESTGGPIGRGIRPVMGESSGRGVPHGMRPAFEGLGGPMPRPGWGGPRMRFPGPIPGEEHIIDDEQDEYNEENAFDNGQQADEFGEENVDEGNEYDAEEETVIEPGFGNMGRGFPGNFGARGMLGQRPPRPGFPQQQPFGAPRPRMDMRAPGLGFGGPLPNFRPRGPVPLMGGPVPLMGIRVRPPSLSESSSADNVDPAKQHGADNFAKNEEIPTGEEEAEEVDEFGEDQYGELGGGFAQTGIRPMGQHGLRPRMVGPRGLLGEQRPMEPGFRPRGPMRFAPRGPGPRGQPQGFDVRGPRPAFGEPSAGQQRGPRPLFGDLASGQRSVRPGFGDSMFGQPPQGLFPRGPHMGGPQRFGGPGEYYGEYGFDEPPDNAGEEEYGEQEENWQQSTTGNNAAERGVTQSDEGKSNTGKPLKLSEHEHELIKKATEELMQKKLPSLDILSKFVSPSDKAASGGGQRKDFENEKPGEQHESISGQKELFNEEFGFGIGRGRDEEFGRGRERPGPFGERPGPFGERPGPFENRRGFPPGIFDEQLHHDEQDQDLGFPPARGRPFMPDRMLPLGERMLPPRDRPFPDDRRFGDRSNFPEGRQEFDPEFRGPPRPGPDFEQRGPGLNRGNRFGGGRGPEDDEMNFHGAAGEEREFRGPRNDPFFRGPREDGPFRGPMDDLRRGEFRGPPGAEFELERRILEERGLDFERGGPRFDRGGRLPRPLGGPRDLFEQEEFPPPPRPFGFGRGGPPSLMDLRRPGPPEPTTIIDYGHGQPDTGISLDERRPRDDMRRREDEMRRERRPDEGFEREFGRPLPPDMRRQFRDEGPPRRRSRSRSPPFPPRDHDTRGQERGNFDRSIRERTGRDREPDRPTPAGGRASENDHSRSHNEDVSRRQHKEPERPGPDARGFPSFSRGGPIRTGFQPTRPAVEEVRVETVAVDDLLVAPGRLSRPDHMVVIIRGPPGAGKTYVSKLLKDKEVANGGTAPRMLCLDDYFVVEVEKTVTEPETGRKVKKMVMEYEYDSTMEPAYRISFLKSFRRQIDDCFFNFIIVDAIFDKAVQLEEFWSYAKSKGFQVYIVDVQADVSTCTKRNVHHRTQADIQKVIDGWDETPKHHIRLDIRSLLQEAAIEDVEMEDTTVENASSVNANKKDEEEDLEVGYVKSKWELDTSEQHLDKLDGIRMNKKKDTGPQRLQDYLQLPDDYESRTSQPGKKRVRWADIEERKDQLRRREIGFVVGQTDWAKMTDDSYADRALNRTKYF